MIIWVIIREEDGNIKARRVREGFSYTPGSRLPLKKLHPDQQWDRGSENYRLPLTIIKVLSEETSRFMQYIEGMSQVSGRTNRGDKDLNSALQGLVEELVREA